MFRLRGCSRALPLFRPVVVYGLDAAEHSLPVTLTMPPAGGLRTKAWDQRGKEVRAVALILPGSLSLRMLACRLTACSQALPSMRPSALSALRASLPMWTRPGYPLYPKAPPQTTQAPSNPISSAPTPPVIKSRRALQSQALVAPLHRCQQAHQQNPRLPH